MARSPTVLLALTLSAWLTVPASTAAQTPIEPEPAASIRDTTTGILGINHIGLSVTDLGAALDFYRAATGYEVVTREEISGDAAADALFGRTVQLRRAILKAPNMLLELNEFAHHRGAETTRMPVQGPGMTHTCYQSPATDPAFKYFEKAGATVLSRGGAPVDLAGRGITYAYLYDPDGNMLETEQLDEPVLESSGYYGSPVLKGHRAWMSQVALATPDIEGLMGFYHRVLGIRPFRRLEIENNPRIDAVADESDSHLIGGWFRLNDKSKVIEMWQFLRPETEAPSEHRDPTSLGYSFSFEVEDIHAETKRLTGLGLEFVSEPVRFGEFWEVYTRDRDGNVFSLRQAVDPSSPRSVRQLDG